MSAKLFTRIRHPHKPRNVNEQHQDELQANFNIRLAVWLTKNVGSMWCAYLFAAIGIGGLVGAITGNLTLALIFGSVSSYFLQLVLLPVIIVGTNVQSRHGELLAEEMYATSQHSFHDIEEIMKHLDAQDAEILKISMQPSWASDIKAQTEKLDEMSLNITAMNKTLSTLLKKAGGV